MRGQCRFRGIWGGVLAIGLALPGCGDSIQIVQPRETKGQNDPRPAPAVPAPGAEFRPSPLGRLKVSGTFAAQDPSPDDEARRARHPSGLAYIAAENWVEEQPGHQMRIAQWTLPPVEADSVPAEVRVLFLGRSQGGSLEGSISRWCGWFDPGDGRTGLEAAVLTRLEGERMIVTRVEVAGSYTPSQMPGSDPDPPIEDAIMIGAVVEGAGGPWYIRCIGPRNTVEHWRASVDSFLATVDVGNS